MILGPYQALGLRFTVSCDHAPTVAVATRVLAGLAEGAGPGLAADGADPVAFELFRSPEGAWEVHADGGLVAEGLAAAAVIHQVIAEVNLRLVDASMDRWTLLHAGGLTRHGRVVALPAPTHAGKSTLVTWLAHHGWEYVTDETVAVEPGTLAVPPYRKPVAIRHGSLPVLAGVIPEVTDADEDYFDWEQLVLPPHSGTCRPGTLAAVVFPRYDADAACPSLAPVRPAEALVRLAHNCHEFERMGAPAFRRLEALARAVPAFDLRYARLGDAATLVDHLMEDLP